MRKLPISKLDLLFSSIAGKMHLYIPTDSGNGAVFKKWSEGTKLSDSHNTTRSPKDFFFPQSEDLMKFQMEGKKISIEDIRSEHDDFAVFGVRACDARASAVLDKVFLTDPVDTYYKNRREHGIIISLSCSKPSETCFCAAFGIDASDPEGDIICHKTDEMLYLKAGSEKGEKLLLSLSDITEECSDDAADAHKAMISERLSRLPLSSLPTDSFGAGKTKELFDSPIWKELSESCLGCGTCTFICPTCQCYDIKDFDNGHDITRYRCWDSCMYSEFTRMSAGQPRLTQTERFRQRFMHKLVYFPERYDGLFGCVGCGRCISKCPIGMNIAKVMKKLGGNADA